MVDPIRITNLEDFELLNPDRDILEVNSQPMLYQGSSEAHFNVLRRLDSNTIMEMRLKKDKIEIKPNGSVRCLGAGSYEATTYSLTGEMYAKLDNDQFKSLQNQYYGNHKKLQEVSL